MDETVFYILMFIIIALFLTYLPFSPCCPWDCNKKNPCSNDDDNDDNNANNANNYNNNEEQNINNLLIPPKYNELINYMPSKPAPPPPFMPFKTHPPPYNL